MSVNRAVYEKRIVAFVDVLGFKTMIEDSETDTALRHKIKRAMEIIRKSASESWGERVVSTFSDSAVISYKLSQSSLFYLLIDIIHLQINLGALGIMIRGGIAIGDCYHDGNVIFGPAMNEAYRLEKIEAMWPRVVILSDTLKKGIVETVDRNPYGVEYDIEEIKSCLKQDAYNDEEDNPKLFFVDFLRQPQEIIEFGDEYYNWLRDFRVAIVQGLNRYSPKNDELEMSQADANKVFKKYRWIMNYWNNVVEDDSAVMPVPDIDKKDEFRERYKKLRIRKRYPYV